MKLSLVSVLVWCGRYGTGTIRVMVFTHDSLLQSQTDQANASQRGRLGISITTKMDNHSRGSKRRLATNDVGDRDAPSSSPPQRRGGFKNDLSEKTTANIDGEDYGYLSSDDDNQSNNANNAAAVADGKKKKERMARKEQRMGLRSFHLRPADNNIRSNTNADEDENNKRGSSNSANGGELRALPNPTGWTQLVTSRQSSTMAFMEDDCAVSMSTATKTKTRTNNNPYAQSKTPVRNVINLHAPTPASSNARSLRSANKRASRTSKHIVCAISENLARETCVASLDASRPTFLHITKQGNGQTYAETMTLLRMLNPAEVLLNEGRKNSQLATKILALFGDESISDGMDALLVNTKSRRTSNNNRRSKAALKRGNAAAAFTAGDANMALSHSECETNTVVKFVPRSYFDQTKGAELLRKLAREDTFTLVEEYILLSSSYALLQYVQLCLGAGLTRGCLAMDINVGGNHRMNIDRTSMGNLELLVNARSGRTVNSLVGTIDCTKTSVGGRLLRTNLMAPPTRLDTIQARLDLVDSLLEDEEFFYVVMEHLEDLPDVDKMLSYVALVPRKRWNGNSNGNGALFGITERQTVTARIASKGISALVCIKSTLSVIPSFAHCLEVQLKELDEREGRTDRGAGMNRHARSDGNDDESTTVIESETSRSENEESQDNDACMTQDSSLRIGLGTASSTAPLPSKQTRHQLLRTILFAMKQPALSRVLSAVSNIFTESTRYSKNSHAMRHQECFALKPNTDGMMDVLRKAFLANVDDIYRLADEYSETYDINVQVRETTSRGYYLSVSADLVHNLPQIFIQPVKSGRFIHCTTEEVR